MSSGSWCLITAPMYWVPETDWLLSTANFTQGASWALTN
jgi:hypothetical protein